MVQALTRSPMRFSRRHGLQLASRKFSWPSSMDYDNSLKKGTDTSIALSEHGSGSGALQKMIESINTEVLTSVVTEALRHRDVALIKELNGNHVIQKCLNKLAPEDNQVRAHANRVFIIIDANLLGLDDVRRDGKHGQAARGEPAQARGTSAS